MTSLLADLLAGVTTRADEERILGLLAAATPDELEALLLGVDTAELFRAVDDHPFGPALRTELIRLLTVTRLGDLSVEARAAVAFGLQAGVTDARDEDGLRNLILGTNGVALTRLKNAINARHDTRDLEGLVYSDVDDRGTRAAILDHIATQASGLDVGKAKVLSDIDDTVFARLHDDRYPKGTLYPGVLAVFEALDDGPDDDPFSTGDLTFVTARPMDALGLIENSTRRALRRAGIAQSAVLSGSFLNLATHDAMAAKKVENIHHSRLLFPEYRLLFLGDSGQGDVLVGEKLLERFADVLDLVLIHDVVATPASVRAEHAGRGIFFHDTYVGAATLLRRRGLISDAGLRRVLTEAQAGLDAVRWDSAGQEAATRALFARDIAAAG